MPVLVVQIHEARGLMAKDDNGLSDPLAEVKYGSLCAHTAVIKETLTPKWEQSFRIPLEKKPEGPSISIPSLRMTPLLVCNPALLFAAMLIDGVE